MAEGENHKMTLAEAAALFLNSLPNDKREASQQEIHKFVQWFGSEHLLAGLTAQEIGNFAERLSLSDTDYMRKLDLVRAFLVQAKKKGWSPQGLAVHLKTKKKPGAPLVAKVCVRETITLTQEGYTAMKNELEALRKERHVVIDEMHRAAADKDFRENAPLHAARERRGHLEGRVKELEETLKLAIVMNGDQKTSLKANIGDKVVLVDTITGEELRYMIVNSKEVDPSRGKISSVSPLGKAVVGQRQGDSIEVSAPAGKICFLLKSVEH